MLSETDSGPAVTSPFGETHPTDQASGNPAQVRCSVCSSTFRRPEHLKRHLRSHTKEKPFECNQCGRHFSRTDTLHRHGMSHHAHGSEAGKDRTHRITVKTFRACFNCATARVRCSGGEPCGRCETRTLGCQYPTERRSKARTNNAASRRLSGIELHGIDEPVRMETPASQQLSQVSVHALNPSHEFPKKPLDDFSITEAHFERASINERVSGVENTNAPMHLPPFAVMYATARLPLSIYQNKDFRNSYGEASNHRPTVLSEPSTDLDTELRGLQSDTASSGVNIDMDTTRNASMAFDFDPSLCDQSMLSTINWLPNEFLRDTRSEVPPENASSQPCHPALPNIHAAPGTWQLPVIDSDHLIQENISQMPPGHHFIGNGINGPSQYPHILNQSCPRPETVDSSKRSVEHSVNDGGTRLLNYKKAPSSWPILPADATVPAAKSPSDDIDVHHLGFPPLHDIHVDNISNDVVQKLRPLQQLAYNVIYRNFLVLCRNKSPFFETFESEIFPSAETCTHFIASFFDSFQTVYPIFHLSTFDPNQCHWLVTIAIAAIGCHSSGIREVDRCTAAFHEMIRRAILAERERHGPNQATCLDLIQAMLLNCVGLFHSRSERARLSALGSLRDLVMLMNCERLLARSPIDFSNDTSNEAKWEKWIEKEIRTRTGYCVWLLDCTLAYYFDEKPLLSLDDGHAPLPAAEKLWHTDSADAWIQLWRESNVNECLYDAIHILYIEKRLITGIGEFSHILLIHALYHRMWEVGDYFRRPLSFWNPTAKKKSRETAIPAGSVWLPGIPSYSKWRNSACDCLDILHWTANSAIVRAAGLEHPTILHLHVARLVLLGPFREARHLATSLASEKLQWSKRHQSIEWQYISRWIKHDQYKARLSIIHAGVALWHIRRYSTDAFHEPVAAFLAVLTLWAFGSCHPQALRESSPLELGSRAERHHEPSLIHLDRPYDDELVQLFVCEGHSMRGSITGAGDICAPKGPERILRVGCEILSSLSAWGISKRLIAILTRLAHMESRHSEGGSTMAT